MAQPTRLSLTQSARSGPRFFLFALPLRVCSGYLLWQETRNYPQQMACSCRLLSVFFLQWDLWAA